MHRRWLSATAILAGIAIVAAACGQAAPSSGGGADKGEIIIASNFPTSGADRASGRGPEAGAAYAIQLNGNIKGFKITHKPYDDAVNGVHDPQKGAQNFTDMVSNAKILGVVGPFNSNVARATIPVANRASLVMISPANTNECLTQDFPYCDPKPAALRPSGNNNYFRIAAPDTVQVPALADFVIDTLKATKVAVWSDNATTNLYFTNAAAEAAQDPANKALIDDFKAKFTAKEDLGAYTFPGYDCAKILLDAIGRAIDLAGGKMPTRDQVVQAVQDTKGLKLSTGTYSFDKNGDPTSATMAFYQYKGGDWSFVKQFSVGQ